MTATTLAALTPCVTGTTPDELTTLAADLRRAGAPGGADSDRVAALLSLADLLDSMAEVAAAGSDDDFDDATARLALSWHRTSRVLDATRPGDPVAGQLADAAVELRRAASA